MKRLTACRAAVLAVALTLNPAHAATNHVLVGQSIQDAIDASAPGDTPVIQAGVYPGNLNFSKPVTVLRPGETQIHMSGAVQVQGAGDGYFSQCIFSSAVTIQATGAASFVQSPRCRRASMGKSGTGRPMGSHLNC